MASSLSAILFDTAPSGTAVAVTPARAPDKAMITRLIEEEARRQGIDPRLAVAIARQESSLNPALIGDNGRSVGLFQLQPAAAIDAGIDPNRRSDVQENIRGGVSYFKQQLAKEGGNVERALSRYNRGTPTYRGSGDPNYEQHVLRYVEGRGAPSMQASRVEARPTAQDMRAALPERPSLAQRLASFLTPASAEAAARPPSSPPASPAGTSLSQELFDVPPATTQGPPPTPAAANALSLSDELFGPAPGTPRSPALAAEQSQAAQRPWWQRGLQAAAEASPEIALMQPQLPQIEQAKAEMTPAERAELRRQEGQSGTLADVGETLGQVAGQALIPVPGVGAAVGGTIGAVSGMTAETLATEGRLPTLKEVGKEALWSAVPEVAESMLRYPARRLLRATPGGTVLRFDEAARRARQWAGETFQPQTREQVGAAFDAVRASGVRLDIGDVRHEVQRLTPGKYDELLAEVRGIDHAHKTGGRFERQVDALRNPQPGTRTLAWDIGDLQQLRSAMRDRVAQLDPAEARQLLGDFQASLDRSVELGLARGNVPAGTTPETLQEARRQWARLRSAEDMHVMIEDKIRSGPNMETVSFRLNTFMDELRRNRTATSRSVTRGLEQTPGAMERFERGMQPIARMYDTIELGMSDVSGPRRNWVVATLGQMLSVVMTTTAGREAFRQAVTDGRGRLSVNALALAVNAGRREMGLPPMEPPPETPAGQPAETSVRFPPPGPPGTAQRP